MFDPLSLIFGLALAAGATPKSAPPASVMPECNELFRGHRSVYADTGGDRYFICVDGVWREEDKSIPPIKPRPP